MAGIDKPGIKDVAAAAGVSVATVSRVYNGSTGVSEKVKEKVLAEIERMGYTANPIASSLKQQRSGMIAVALTSLNRSTMGGLLRGIYDALEKKGYRYFIVETGYSWRKEKELIESVLSQYVDGIIIMSQVAQVDTENKEYVDFLGNISRKGATIPVVTLQLEFPHPNVDAVIVDYEEAAYKAVYHLFEIGRKKVAFIAGPQYDIIYDYRLRGYKKALNAFGAAGSEMVINCDYRQMTAYRAMMEIIDSHLHYDGIYVATDEMAFGVLCACKERGVRVPDDVAVIGNNNIVSAAAFEPPLSTVDIPRYQMGKKAAEILLYRIENGNSAPKKRIIAKLPNEIMIRASTLKSARQPLDANNVELTVEDIINNEA